MATACSFSANHKHQTTSLSPFIISRVKSSVQPHRRQTKILTKHRSSIHYRNNRWISASPSSLWTTTTTTTVSTDIDTINKDDDATSSLYDPFATANKIEPQTKPLPESMSFYAKYLINYFCKTPKLGKKIRGQRRAMWKKLNEQRKNVMTLAGYTSDIVTPSFGFLFLGALMTSIVPNYWGKCIQCVATLSATKGQLLEAIVGLGVTSTLAALFTGIRGSLFWIGGCRANYNVRVKLHRSLLLQEAAFFDTNETGYLLSRLNSDVNKIGQVISYHVNVVLRQFAQFVFGSIYLIKISPKLSLWTFAGIVLVAWLSAVYGDLARQLAEKVQDTFADATAVAETSFSMSETIRAFDGAEIESDKFEAAQSKALELEEVQAWAYGTHKFLSDTLQSILQVGLLVACWAVGKSGGLPASELTTFMFYTGFVLESSNEVGDQWAKIQQAVGASSSVFDLIKRIPAIRDPPASGNASASAPGIVNGVETDSVVTNGHDSANNVAPIIALKNVTVEYEAMERPALMGINAKIYSGDRVALVGRSGSGKSSMLRTMLRFYDPSVGAIELDGQDLRKLTRAETASHVSLVEQEPHVFPMSLMENVLYGIDKDDVDSETGKPQYSAKYRKKVADCLSLAGIPVEPGNELGLTLDTRIGEGGRSLSGGQRQRVAIARAIIRSPQVLLLDEPTAALDSESERKVVESLQKAMEQTKSMVMVTHRLGVVRSLDVNRVIVLDRGEIVEEGHPEDLLQDEGSLYAAIAREQGITKLSTLNQNQLTK
ncbi:ABC transporter [Nitzschia inconspicua]|uniref:ABC transporter n=1 Tax=Nitzschia inconspicua TaxID=303405 RepID=A0A9K3LM96_9STRA|nr:ABC transporter [Nitzschia inconspicua]